MRLVEGTRAMMTGPSVRVPNVTAVAMAIAIQGARSALTDNSRNSACERAGDDVPAMR